MIPAFQLKGWFGYSARLIVIYCVLYYGTQAVIGVSAPGGKYYSPVVARYCNYPAALRKGLLHTSAFMLRITGRKATIDDLYKVRQEGGRGVKVVYSCLATGIISFWLAFVFAESTSGKRKIIFAVTGTCIIFLINALRLCLLVIAANGGLSSRFISDHHTFFNITAYVCVLLMMFMYVRKSAKQN